MRKYSIIALVFASLIFITPFTVIAEENKIISRIKDKQDIEKSVAQIRLRINENKKKYENKLKLSGFFEMILFLLDFLLYKIVQVAYLIIFIPLSVILSPLYFFLVFFILFFMMG
jgi:YbbR domain-containing protein